MTGGYDFGIMLSNFHKKILRSLKRSTNTTAIVWRRPRAHSDGFLDNFTPWVADAWATATPFLAVGDWNWEPDENVFTDTGLQHCAVTEGACLVPSRW